MFQRQLIIAITLASLLVGQGVSCLQELQNTLPRTAATEAIQDSLSEVMPFVASGMETEQIELDRSSEKQNGVHLCRSLTDHDQFLTHAKSLPRSAMRNYFVAVLREPILLLLCECARLERSGVFLS